MNKYKSINIIKVIFLISILSLLFISCKQDPSSLYNYSPPENIGDGLEAGSLEEVNIDQALIEKAVNDINQGKYKEVHSMLIFKNDKLVLDEYFNGHKYQWDAPNFYGELVTWDRNMMHSVMSVTKSITSTCIGIAVNNGFIESVNQSIFDYLPEHQYLNTDGKDKITIEHLLTMTSGLQWNEWNAPYTSLENDMGKLWFYCEDPITCVLEAPLVNEPGESFTYNGGGMIVLGEIIKNATGMNLDEFSIKYLFEPLGIDYSIWSQFENGVIDAAGSLIITPRDLAKIGVTFLNNGVWNGKQIVSEQWVEKSATKYPGPGNSWFNSFLRPIPPDDTTWGRRGYAYSWWIHQFSNSGKKINIYYAGGWGGQNIMVLPDQNTVVVFTGGNYTSKVQTFKIIEKYILPAID